MGKSITLVTLSILARFLVKTEFGLVAVAMVAINYLSVFKDLGLGAALIQRRGDIEAAADTVFTLNLAVGLTLTLLVFPAAPLVAWAFDTPAVVPVLRWLGVIFVIDALGSIHLVRLKREMDFRLNLLPELGNAIVKGGVSIGMAFYGYGIWAIVIGQVAGAITANILAWRVFRWHPKIHIERSIAGALAKYGMSVMGSDLIGIMFENLVPIIIGRTLGMVLLGVYSLAYRLPETLVISVLWLISTVMFPAFAAIQDQNREMVAAFLKTTRLVQIVATPICLGLMIAADPIIRVIFGDQWLDAIPILRLLAVFAWVYTLGYHVGLIYKAVGRPDILFRLSLFGLVIAVPAVLAGVRFGLEGVVLAQVAVVTIRRIVGMIFATRYVAVTIPQIMAELKPALKCGLVLCAFSTPVLYLTSELAPAVRLLAVSATGATAYLGTLWVSEKAGLIQIFRLVSGQGKAAA